eukprot:g38026.t1
MLPERVVETDKLATFKQDLDEYLKCQGIVGYGPSAVGQILNNDKLEYRKEVENLVAWCRDNNFSLNPYSLVNTAQSITQTSLPSIDSIYISRYLMNAANVIKNPSHTSYTLFHPILTVRRYKSLKTQKLLTTKCCWSTQVVAAPLVMSNAEAIFKRWAIRFFHFQKQKVSRVTVNSCMTWCLNNK